MTARTNILAGATLALLIAAGQASAAPQDDIVSSAPDALLLAQSDANDQSEEEHRKQPPEAQQEDSAPTAAEPAPAEVPAQPAPPPQAEEPATPPEQPVQPAQPESDSAAPTPGEPPAEAEPPVPTEAPPPPQAEQPATPPEQPVQPAQPESDSAAPMPGELPAETKPPVPTEAPPPPQAEQPAAPEKNGAETTEPARNAPVLDSDKEDEEASPGQSAPQQQPAVPAAPPPASDAEAQQLEQPVHIQPLREEKGRPIQRREQRDERREGVDVLREIGDRVLLQLGNHTIVQSDDRDRIERNASKIDYEELPRGRTRETITRANGVQVVTIRDRYGDIIRRSRITPDGREYVLVYAGDERGREERHGWRDPGRDLPPLHLSIPAHDYIFDAGQASDPRAYYDFLEQPPVEPVRRLYSVDEVRYSARIRDSVRRIDLDTITFDFGSATIAETAIPRLAGLADAIGRLLDANPAETFLIEGHTDAVGSDLANLALSDRRAEAIAAALTNVFDIPPENLVTQGYGERYLKVKTQEPERENRRVAVRRITPLVAPVASRR